jgi:hypothetical protein
MSMNSLTLSLFEYVGLFHLALLRPALLRLDTAQVRRGPRSADL